MQVSGCSCGELAERAAELEVDVFDLWVALKDAEDLADPGDFLRVVGFGIADFFAGAGGEKTRPAVGRVINDEVQIGPILGGFFEVERHAGFLVERAQRQAFVDAEVLDAELARSLPKRIRDFLVVHEPGLLAELGAGVHLPGVDLELFDLPLHLFEFALAEVRPQQTVRQNALRRRRCR